MEKISKSDIIRTVPQSGFSDTLRGCLPYSLQSFGSDSLTMG